MAFNGVFTNRQFDVSDKQMAQRLRKLEAHLQSNFTIEEMPNGWKCTAKRAAEPGFIVTPDSVLFVMKNLGI